MSSTDFIEALKNANDICINITQMLRSKAEKLTSNKSIVENIQVFPYR